MEDENKQNAPEPGNNEENQPVEEPTPRPDSGQAPPAAESIPETPAEPAPSAEEPSPPVEEAKEEERVEEKAEEQAPPVEEVKEEPAPPVEEAEEPASAEAPAGEEEKVEEPKNADRRWYVIQTLTGQEDKVKHAVEQTIESNKLKDKLFQVLVPTEEIVEIKGGKRVEKVKKMFPGYVFLEMVLDDESWFNIRNTPWVARFIGTKVRPTPVSDREMQRVLKQLGKEEKLLEITFERGEGVRVISGPFRGYTGTVDEVNADKGKMKVLINIFGRDTPVEVNFEHAQKMI